MPYNGLADLRRSKIKIYHSSASTKLVKRRKLKVAEVLLLRKSVCYVLGFTELAEVFLLKYATISAFVILDSLSVSFSRC
jgi:hypothetical protein